MTRKERTTEINDFVKSHPAWFPQQIADALKVQHNTVLRAFGRLGMKPNYYLKKKECELFKVRNGVIIDVNPFCPITGFPANKFQNIVQP